MAKTIAWIAQARADLRVIEQHTAMRILHSVARFAATQEGDVKQMRNVHPPELRLRVGDYRVRFCDHGDHIEILTVKHRRQAYR